jgi:hypothetical protein
VPRHVSCTGSEQRRAEPTQQNPGRAKRALRARHHRLALGLRAVDAGERDESAQDDERAHAGCGHRGGRLFAVGVSEASAEARSSSLGVPRCVRHGNFRVCDWTGRFPRWRRICAAESVLWQRSGGPGLAQQAAGAGHSARSRGRATRSCCRLAVRRPSIPLLQSQTRQQRSMRCRLQSDHAAVQARMCKAWPRGLTGAARCVAGGVSVATKALTSALIVGAGDVACQTLLERRSLTAGSARAQHESQGPQQPGDMADRGGGTAASRPFDYARLGNMTLLGAVLVAPVLHVWYGFLGRKIPGSSVGPVVGRVVLDQALFAPTFIAVFFSALAVCAALSPLSLQIAKSPSCNC